MATVCVRETCGTCACCTNRCLSATPTFATPAASREAARTARKSKKISICRPVGFGARGAKRMRVNVAHDRLCSFLRLLALLDTAPWASTVFKINDNMIRVLCATHLHLIVGKKEFAQCDRPTLLRLIDPGRQLDGYSNLVWVTNRQQGKTSTLGKFIGALAIFSPVGGDLCNVYATSLDRANELTKAAKQYVRWVRLQPGWSHVQIVKNNNTTFVVSKNDGTPDNIVVARPKNPDSCRGDAPEACFFDEVGFVGEAFWWKASWHAHTHTHTTQICFWHLRTKLQIWCTRENLIFLHSLSVSLFSFFVQFALPLLQVSLRTATATTTPPPVGGFFDVFLQQIKKRNAEGDHFFYLENHSLSCEACCAVNEQDRCCHHLHFVPPWKSMLRFTSMRALVPKKHVQTFQTEVYGILQANQASYFPPALVDAAFDRERLRTLPDDIDCVWVGIDPAGHSVSDMGLCAVIFDKGRAVIIGCASVNMARSDVAGVLALLKVFLRRLRTLVPAPVPLCPIVEVNNNEVYSHTLAQCFNEFSPVYIPWTKKHFRVAVCEGIGVRTTRETKMQMVQHGYLAFVEGRVVVAERTAHVCKADTASKIKQVNPEDHLEELADQLKRMADCEKTGEITGKTTQGDNDDICIAFLLALYWSACARAAEEAEKHAAPNTGEPTPRSDVQSQNG